ncbi:MAG: hypothetical protein JWO77_1570, partial [Ilumatobacteraceae bacterium]|nr:hypothetical protein [Ilumatobacteraceae bacterium]
VNVNGMITIPKIAIATMISISVNPASPR